MQQKATQTYEQYNAKKTQLLELIAQSEKVFDYFNMSEEIEACQRFQTRLTANTFKVLVLGEFKRGKSTFINALLKNELLPADVTPCTAVINEIKWGDNPTAYLYISPDVESLPEQVPDAVQEHFDQFLFESQNQSISPLKIPIEQLNELVTITDLSQEQGKAIAQSPYEKVEIFYPLELCKNGVEIIDSPGLNEHKTRTQVTTNYLSRVDAVLFVTMVSQLASQSEKQVIEQLREMGHKEIFFVINRWDEVTKASDKKRVRDFANASLAPLTSLGEDGLFFISALDALDGYLDQDDELIEQSNLIPLENALAKFLTEERGRIKLRQPSQELLSNLEKVSNQIIPDQLAMLDSSYEEIKKRYEERQPLLEQAKSTRYNIHEKLEDEINILEDRIKQQVKSMIFGMIDEIDKNYDSFQAETQFNFLNTQYEEQAEKIALEIVNSINSFIESQQQQWQEKTIKPIIENKLTQILEGIKIDIQSLIQKLKSVTQYVTKQSSQDLTEGLDSEVDQLMATAFQVYLEKLDQDASSYYGGTEGLVKSIGVQLAIITSLIFVTISNPLGWVIGIVGFLITIGPFKNLLPGNQLSEYTDFDSKIKEAVIEKYKEELQTSVNSKSNEVANEIKQNLEIIIESIDQTLENKIQSCQEQVESALQRLSEKEEEIEQSKKDIEAWRYDLSQLQQNCKDFLISQQRQS